MWPVASKEMEFAHYLAVTTENRRELGCSMDWKVDDLTQNGWSATLEVVRIPEEEKIQMGLGS